MKQKINGKKVQNWHRPLGRDELKQRYVRARYNTPDVGGEPVDQTFNSYLDQENRLHEYRESRLIEDLYWSEILDVAPIPIRPSADLATRLAAYIDLANDSTRHNEWFRTVLAAIANEADLEFIRNGIRSGSTRQLFRNIAILAPFWIRRPADGPREGREEILRHLFAEYDVPGFCLEAWEHTLIDSYTSLGVLWTVVLGQGGSLRRTGRLLGYAVTGKLAAHLDREFLQDKPFIWSLGAAEILRRGGSRKDCDRLMGVLGGAVELNGCGGSRQGFFVCPSIRRGAEQPFIDGLVDWVIAHGDALTDEEFHAVCDWARHEFQEAALGRRSAETFSMRGRSIHRVRERAEQYRQEIHAWDDHSASWDAETLQWNGQGVDWHSVQNGSHWEFRELTSGSELVEEGRALSHCVGSYATRCYRGGSVIVSLRRDGARCLTVELRGRGLKIAQALGYRNRKPHFEERDVLARWRKEIA